MTVQRYTKTAIALHWVIALGIVINVALAWVWPKLLPEDAVRPAIDFHKSIGVTVLGLAAMRLLWRAGHPPPPLPATYHRWETTLSSATHMLLYLIMFGMPLTGWIMDSAWKDAASHPMIWFGLFEWPRLPWIMHLPAPEKKQIHDAFGEAHELLGWTLYGLFTLHVAGALKHQWIDKDPELQRISPFG